MQNKKWYIRGIIGVVLMLASYCSFAQDPTDSLPGDPAALLAYNMQGMSFGTISHNGTGGTVTISNTGTRSTGGSVLGLNIGSYYQAIFEIEAPPFVMISITKGPNPTLSNGTGGTLQLTLGNPSPASPFLTTVAPPARTPVNIGGTLTVGNSGVSPPGVYTGSFYLTFNIE